MKTVGRTIEELTTGCLEEVATFHKTNQSNSPSCYELFRRALDEIDQKAFAAIFQIYERQVLSWITKHPVFWLTHCSSDDYVNVAFSRFYFALKGNIVSGFSSVDRILSYLKSCVHTAIIQEYRKQKKKIAEEPIDNYETLVAPPSNQPHEFETLWTHLCALIPDNIDQLLMRRAFIEQLKPQVIAAEHPEHWESARDVSVALYRIRKILRTDPALRELIGLAD